MSTFKSFLDVLTPVERDIMIRRYGLKEYKDKEMTQKQVGEELGIHPKFISRIEKNVIADLQFAMESIGR